MKYLATLCLVVLTVYAHAQKGTIDETFGNNGFLSNDHYELVIYTASANDDSDKITTVGYAKFEENYDFIVEQYLSTSSRNIDFGDNGVVQISFGVGHALAHSVAIQEDNKILIAGQYNSNFAIARLLPNGALDPSFGVGGKVVLEQENFNIIYKILVQNDSKILLAGQVLNGINKSDFALLRLLENGALDHDFSDNGIQIIDVDLMDDAPLSLALQSDNKILLCGTSNSLYSGSLQSRIVRYHPNGSLDNSFANNGILTLEDNNRGMLMQLNSFDQILIAYNFLELSTGWSIHIQRFTRNGSLDESFGEEQGLTRLTVPNSTLNFVRTLHIDSDCQIVVASESQDNIGLFRFNENGIRDTDFVMNRVLSTILYSPMDMMLQSNGQIILTTRQTILQFNNQTCSTLLSTSDINSTDIELSNTPNPFHTKTIISYHLSKRSTVHLAIYDVLGRHITTLVNETQQTGKHNIVFQPKDRSIGQVYIGLLKTDDGVIARKMMIQ